jgi:hypothetical protein
VVVSHGGTVALGSSAPDGGTRIEVRIPADGHRSSPAHLSSARVGPAEEP